MESLKKIQMNLSTKEKLRHRKIYGYQRRKGKGEG